MFEDEPARDRRRKRRGGKRRDGGAGHPIDSHVGFPPMFARGLGRMGIRAAASFFVLGQKGRLQE